MTVRARVRERVKVRANPNPNPDPNPNPNPNQVRTGALLEAGTLLGPFLRLSCFPNDAALVSECFGDLTQHHSLESSLSTLRMSLQACTAP